MSRSQRQLLTNLFRTLGKDSTTSLWPGPPAFPERKGSKRSTTALRENFRRLLSTAILNKKSQAREWANSTIASHASLFVSPCSEKVSIFQSSRLRRFTIFIKAWQLRFSSQADLR